MYPTSTAVFRFFGWILLLTTAILPTRATMAQPQLFTNHIGYEQNGPKRFVFEAGSSAPSSRFRVVNSQQETVYEGTLHRDGPVDEWQDWTFWSGDFSSVNQEGRYRVVVDMPEGELVSEPFVIRRHLLAEESVPEIMTYFASQRTAGPYNEADRSMTFYGDRDDVVDVHGGWYDASGDVSKYLSHLSYANYMNPQQTPMAVWILLHAATLLQESPSSQLAARVDSMRTEALYGADFLVRMQDSAGYFYATVFDRWSHDPEQREICAYRYQTGDKNENYEAAYREGGGLTIAALARASTLDRDRDYTPADYLAAAKKGFDHLEAHNHQYVNDGKENIIDDYAALLAALELYAATDETTYLNAAQQRGAALVARLSEDANYTGWWRADDTGDRPYFHAAEAGLPVVALLRYLEIAPEAAGQDEVLEAIRTSLDFELAITDEVTNPFGYARQYVKPLDQAKRGAFFIPHQNESGYWWQGENARLGSLASAALLASQHFDGAFRETLRRYALDQINWILGLNPFDISMLQGKGRNNPDYMGHNVRGGVANGITAGFDDPHDIAFMPPEYADDPSQNWRWAEQWLPHDAWLLMALSSLETAMP